MDSREEIALAEEIREILDSIIDSYVKDFGLEKIVYKAQTYVNRELKVEVHSSIEVKEKYDNGGYR
jgi:hypothetical protein